MDEYCIGTPGTSNASAPTFVMTVLGPVDPGMMGITLHHEHLITKPTAITDPDLVLDDVDCTVQSLLDAHRVGLGTIVDMTPVDYGRDLDRLRWIGENSPVHVIATTGHLKELHAARWVKDKSVEALAAEMVADLQVGAGPAQVRAGVIKAGTSFDRVTAREERVLRAAAAAHNATGAPISTHTDKGTMALEQLAILRSEGVDLRRVIVGHLDFCLDREYLYRVLATGAFVSFDQVSKEHYGSDLARARMLALLMAEGWGGQLLVSSDLARRSSLPAYGGTPGLTYVIRHFPEMLRREGACKESLQMLFENNPSRALAITGGDGS